MVHYCLVHIINQTLCIGLCVEIKQNKSEVGSDILLVSDFFLTLNTTIEFEPDTCEPYNIKVYVTYLLDLCDMKMYLRQVSGFNIHIILKRNKTSETSNMSLPTSDSFHLITTHIFLNSPNLACTLLIS